MVPRSPVGIYGVYCSWNCAKRGLLGLRTRPWFALLAITALKSGATLPIVIAPKGKKPACPQIVKNVPSFPIQLIRHVTIPYYTECELLGEPVVYPSTSISHASLLI